MSKVSIEEARKLSNKAAEEVRELFQKCPGSSTSPLDTPTQFVFDLIGENAKLKRDLFYWKRLAQEAVDALQQLEQEILESDI